MNISLIPTDYESYENIEINQGQLLYCIDNGSAFYDVDDKLRIPLSTTRQLQSEQERIELENPEKNILYIIKNDEIMYRYYDDMGWLYVNTYAAIEDLIITAEDLIPFIIENNGVKFAPKVLAKYIYMNDGSTLQNSVDQLLKKGAKVVLKSNIHDVQARFNKQKTIDIPYPISDYDVYRFPFVLLIDNKRIKPSQYAIGKNQVILTDEIADTIKKNVVITFIFVYAHTLADVELDCQSINGVRWFVGPTDLAIDLRQDNDMMLNTFFKELKRWHHDTQEWEVILSDRKRLVKWVENEVICEEPSSYVDIGIEKFDKDKDKLIVIKDGLTLQQDKDYFISGDSTFIKPPDGYTWDTETRTIFHFLVLKNVPNISYDEWNEDNFESPVVVKLKSEISELRAMVMTLEQVVNKSLGGAFVTRAELKSELIYRDK